MSEQDERKRGWMPTGGPLPHADPDAPHGGPGSTRADGVMDGDPPRIAGMQPHLPDPHPMETAEAPGGGGLGERTGEQSFLPPGSKPGEQAGPAMRGPGEATQEPRSPGPPGPDPTEPPRG